MKPHEARAMRLRQDQAKAARGAQLEEYLHNGGATTEVVPHLIPTEADLQQAVGEVRALVRRANRTRKGSRRMKVLDQLVSAAGRLVFVERVLELDRLERAALTPARLVAMSKLGAGDIRERMARWQGEAPSGLEVPS